MQGHPDTIIDELDRDWQHLRTSEELDSAFARWRRTDDRLAPFGHLAQLFDFLEIRRTPSCDKSNVLLALLTIGREDQLAARVVPSAVRPGAEADGDLGPTVHGLGVGVPRRRRG